MEKICQGPGCGIKFQAVRKSAKYHSDTCRQRARRHPDQIGKGGGSKPAGRGRRRLQAATLKELAGSQKQGTPHGIVALELAEAIDAGAESAAALASLATAFDRAMSRALEGGPEDDPVKARQARVAGRLSVVSGGG